MRPTARLSAAIRSGPMASRNFRLLAACTVISVAGSQVAAVAMPDAELGERVCVYAVLTPGATLTLDAVRAAMTRAHVARYKWPEHLVVVPELPATKVGKIDKKALRADIAARLARG